ncbi:MAG: hypothetical protein IJT09_02630 [Abditibacteriota bacterium]|nr:hypothetical protein [Abditibacteriota bacterium]
MVRLFEKDGVIFAAECDAQADALISDGYTPYVPPKKAETEPEKPKKKTAKK